MATFATQDEAQIALDQVLEICQRFPIEADQALSNVVGAHAAFAGAIRSTEVVAPELAKGTHHYRAVHGLPAIVQGEG